MAQAFQGTPTYPSTPGSSLRAEQHPTQHRNPSSFSGHLERPAPTITNADDSIVLSDLVRTGEASRLRRRGALRLDRNSMSSGLAHHHRHLSFDSEFDDDSGHWLEYSRGTPHDRMNSSHSRWTSGGTEQEAQSDGDSEDEYTLVCGADVEPSTIDGHWNRSEPFEPSILPIPPTNLSREPSYSRPTNGCGAAVHLGASPGVRFRRGHGNTYIAQGKATDSVAPMEIEYFDEWPDLKFESNACGCVKEGVGCVVCGNPLGTRWKFCRVMADEQRKAARRNSGRRRSPTRSGFTPYDLHRWEVTTPSREPCLLDPLSSSPSESSSDDDSVDSELYSFFCSSVTIHREHVNHGLSRYASPTAPAKPSQDWPADVTYIAEPPQPPPDFDWLGTHAGHYDHDAHSSDRSDRTTPSTSYPGLAINVEVTVASSVSYPDLHRTPSAFSSTVQGPERRPAFATSQSAPPVMYGFSSLTASPESIAQPLPRDDYDYVGSRYGDVGVDRPTSSSVAELLPTTTTFYEDQLRGAAARERQQALGGAGEWSVSSRSPPSPNSTSSSASSMGMATNGDHGQQAAWATAAAAGVSPALFFF